MLVQFQLTACGRGSSNKTNNKSTPPNDYSAKQKQKKKSKKKTRDDTPQIQNNNIGLELDHHERGGYSDHGSGHDDLGDGQHDLGEPEPIDYQFANTGLNPYDEYQQPGDVYTNAQEFQP